MGLEMIEMECFDLQVEDSGFDLMEFFEVEDSGFDWKAEDFDLMEVE